MAKISLLLADGRKLLREGLSVLLERHDDIHVAGEVSDVASALRLLVPLRVNGVVLNVNGSTQASAEAVRAICAAAPACWVVALAVNPSPTGVRQLLDAGALGCLTKECASVDLVAAVRAASEGRRYLSPRLAEAIVANYMRPADRDPLRTLAPREREVLCAIASGKTTKQIAFGLGVATKTVETHRHRRMEKLRLYSVAELTQFALREGLIELETNAC